MTDSYDKFYTPENRHFYAKFKYKPLNPKRQEIRFVRVFPRRTVADHHKIHSEWSNNNSMALDSNLKVLACQLENTALTRIDGRYSTISYCAGNLQDTKVVLVNGLPFDAFANLEHAMECVLNHHPPSESGYMFWLDQICINQSDKQELGHQVQFRRQIYS
ncbi:hypothetical protein BX600DRAFT_434924 [Xylariales sp. PMI_506]|nr:hypothetical protein BX600DRAFT_434924 [Xylariales sp. PMI_506]